MATTTPISKANNTSPPNRYPIIDEFCSEKTILKALTTAPSDDEYVENIYSKFND